MEDFEITARKFLEDLYEELDLNQNLEANLTSDGVLLIKAPNGDYAINKHSITKQIWYSSPVSSLRYFIFQEQDFVDKKNHSIKLREVLFNDINKI